MWSQLDSYSRAGMGELKRSPFKREMKGVFKSPLIKSTYLCIGNGWRRNFTHKEETVSNFVSCRHFIFLGEII